MLRAWDSRIPGYSLECTSRIASKVTCRWESYIRIELDLGKNLGSGEMEDGKISWNRMVMKLGLVDVDIDKATVRRGI